MDTCPGTGCCGGSESCCLQVLKENVELEKGGSKGDAAGIYSMSRMDDIKLIFYFCHPLLTLSFYFKIITSLNR